MATTAVDLLSVLPDALALTAGADHVVEWLSPRGEQLFGVAVRRGHPIRDALPAGDLLGALDDAFRSGETTVVPRGVLSSVVDETPSGPEFGVSCSPVGDGPRRISGLLVRVLTDGPDDDARSRARAREFQHLTEQLSSAATPADIGRLTATSAATLIGADACAVYARAEGAQVVESLHHEGWPEDVVERFRRLTLERGRPLSDAVLTGRPVWLENAEQWRSCYPEMAPVGVAGGHQASACLPLRVEDRELGAAVFSFYRSRAFDLAEREFLLAVASLCAQALDRARLYAAEREARAAAERERDRMSFLARTSQLMEAPLSLEERLRQLADLAVTGIADWSAVHLVRGSQVERVAVAHLDPAKVAFVEELERRYPPSPDAPGGALEVARTGVAVVMSEVPDELLVASAQDETHLELIRAIGLRSAIVVPLLTRGRCLGALTLVHAESGERFTDDDLTFVGQLATTAALALDNAALYERQRTVARTLQAALLPAELPHVPGVQFAGRYRPPSPELTDVYVGGDIYDIHEDCERGRWALTVADVCGKGPQAAALTALIRHTIHAEVGHGFSPAGVLRRVNAAMLRHCGGSRARFATMVHGALTVGPGGVGVTLVNGGHPPGLVLRGDRVESIVVPGTLVGVYPDLSLAEVEVHLGPRDTLLLYTDGVTEARGRDGFFGSARLEAVLASFSGESADVIADGILAHVSDFQDGRLRDDVALLAVQVEP
ncbi:SpoIIE family protein phosphatase [Actinomycetospora sp. TBRC 11914]|uniref:SpoIIE family protein phosphatase n=1 Tax=Actinomycetospora sp. TBRC 11914 TaxID=2729387 RepID=UPI00145D92CC|nr:SpoIIE family protein phosphatase [Actinomycetospora sp. TBRC 11914]NMO88349.1 SpoIIE family protein phosphatase [Actinomycetospora sp. TBRC 11914]